MQLANSQSVIQHKGICDCTQDLITQSHVLLFHCSHSFRSFSLCYVTEGAGKKRDGASVHSLPYFGLSPSESNIVNEVSLKG